MLSIPFSGNKRLAYKTVKPIVNLGRYERVYEPFGGSGVLSVNLYNDGIISKAVVNDYDRFFDEYKEYLDLKDFVVSKCFEAGLEKTQGLLDRDKRVILQEIIDRYVPRKFWRYFLLGGNFNFSAVINHLKQNRFDLWDFCKFSGDLTTENGRAYLDVYEQLQIEHLDYKDFLDKFSYDPKSLLIVDPPYIDTCMDQYEGMFKEGDTEELIVRLKQTNCDFIFFNQEEDRVKEWLKDFENVEYYSVGRKDRPDVMAYVKR